MTAPHADQLMDGYLARLRAAAGDLPPAARDELIDDVRSHITEARARGTDETDAAILNILDRLGEPSAVVAETRDRLGIRPSQAYRPGLLEIFALILLPFFWPVGVILLWISPAWQWRDKLIGTLLPPGGYMGIGIFALLAAGVHAGCHELTDATGRVIESSCQRLGPFGLTVWLVMLMTIVLYVLPLITAGYLAVRLRWGRGPKVAIA